ncbi:hypothetical protein CLI64_11185 [Nostoc sp. CENA543]|uniref:hypothetical protein n=1 Tax=Nostoc sp. CENA543 TaxID=1869241 RepID=UPI000CA18D25|nr:hypothetical protein [Nostoc sp. CENA543]AUT00918.1 hypothetical protein CLI64_11185 [Nostoc sp. CENA543]
MTTITGTFSNGAAVVPGKLVVTLVSGTVKDTAPKTVYLPKPIEVLCPSGAVPGGTNLEETETKNVSYLFEYFPRISTSPDVFSEDQLSPFPFYAVVPNIASVDLADLAPTGYVSDTLATGALRIARVIAGDPSLASSIGGVNPRGAYNNATAYKRGDIVSYLNRAFIATQTVPFTGFVPTNTSYWMELPLEPSGSLVLGSSAAYGAGWSASGLAPSQDAVYNILETIQTSVAAKANSTAPNISDANLTGTPVAPTATNGTATVQIANTAFVQQLSRPAWNVFANADQTQNTDNYTVIFNGENLDTNNAYSGGTFVCPSGFSGFYLVGGGIYLQNLDTNQRVIAVELRINGSFYRRVGEVILLANTGIHVNLSTQLIPLNAGHSASLVLRTFGTTFTYRAVAATTNWWGFRLPI